MKITVIITSYNYDKYLQECIDSVLSQTYKNFELIIVDDYSEDSSWDIICKYKEDNPEIVTIRHDYNWKDGIVADIVKNYATGDYIALQNSDDVWEPDKLEKQVIALKEHPDCAAVFTNAVAIDDFGNPYNDEDGFYFNLFNVENKTRYEWLRHFFYEGNCLCHPSILIKKDIYMENDFFMRGLRQIPDYVKWIQICKRHDIYVLPEPLLKFRIHSGGRNASGMTAEKQIRSTVELFLMLKEYTGIDNKEEFLKIFPEAEKFCEKTFIPEYAFGRVCMQKQLQPYTRLYGMQLIYALINDEKKREILKSEYNYTPVDFMNETGKQDIFGILPDNFDQIRTLYYDCGKGFDIAWSVVEKYTFNDRCEFSLKCDIEISDRLIKLRFDPAEGVITKSKIINATINGNSIELKPENSFCKLEEENIFISIDPIYMAEIEDGIVNAGKNIIEINGYIERLSPENVAKIVMEEMYKQRDEFYMLQEKLYNSEELNRVIEKDIEEKERQINCLNNDINILNNELNILNNELNILNNELNIIKNSKIYKTAKKMGFFKNIG